MKSPPYFVYLGDALRVNLSKCTDYTNKFTQSN